MERLYRPDQQPVANFNTKVLGWLDGSIRVREHAPVKAFSGLLETYIAAFKLLLQSGSTKKEAHFLLMSKLTELMLGIDLGKSLAGRLDQKLINESGFRSALSQGIAKNNGENFVNIIVYVLADLLSDQDEVLVDKGTPSQLRSSLTLVRECKFKNESKSFEIPIETDFCIFSRSNPHCAIIISAKTRLKEVFHIGTMWKLFFDMLSHEHSQTKWSLSRKEIPTEESLTYVFATADMVPKGGKNSQGPDVERNVPRNLIAMDASFFDYVFVSKTSIPHVSKKLEYHGEKEALFHELGCLINLVEQKFGIVL